MCLPPRHQWRYAHCGRYGAVHCSSWSRSSTRFYHSARKRRRQEHNSWPAKGNGTRQCRQYRHLLTHSISIAIGTNPGAGTLIGNMTVTSMRALASRTLSINQPGNGYTLTASAAGLTSAISNPFNITSPTGTGIIAGVITRVSNGATITGALVEAFQGTALRGTAVTNSSGNYSITGLATGTYTVRASFAGLVPQILNSVIVTSGNTTTVDLSLNFGIAVQSPVAGATVSDFSVLVTGHFDTSLASEVGIHGQRIRCADRRR